MKNKMIRFVHDRHQLYTVEQNKTSLSPFNDKRYILEDGVSHSFGHYEIDLVNGLDELNEHDFLGEGNQISLEPFSDSARLAVEMLGDGSFGEFNDNDMELVDVLDDLMCEGNKFL